MDFSVSGLKYDANGNITAMKQRGVNLNTPVTIDSLTYTYFTNSNQLRKVDDAVTDATPWGDFKDTSLTANDYVYDVNGNLVKDNNKHIHTSIGANGIVYNFLDKPDNINVNGKGSIAYTYDAAGALLQKTINDTKLNTKTVITYIAGFVYQKVLPSGGNASNVPDTLQYVLHEEGRIRYLSLTGGFAYDYFLKDHLGNIRSVVTEEQDTAAYPVASLETATINNEKIYYSGLDNGIVNKSSVNGYPTNDTYTNPNNFIQKLSGSTTGTKIGAGILLKVMAGDKINVHTSSWYKLDGATPDPPANPLTDIVNALTASVPLASGGKVSQTQLTTTVLNPGVNGFLNTRDATANTARPNAWLNIIVFDEQMNLVNTNDGKNTYYEQVGGGNTSTVKQYNVSQREITKSGYVYIYVSNETPNVYTYWDNLQVTHIKGPLLQEEGYYPFGLEMKAISSQAFVIASSAKQSYKFNGGTELNESFDVDYYETYFRNYDAQIGRFTGIDALAEANINQSPYAFANNDPIYFNDPTGLDAWDQYWAYDHDHGGYHYEMAMDGGSGGGNTAQGIIDIINSLYNSSDGGQWSANDPYNIYKYGDYTTALLFGGMAKAGTPFDFRPFAGSIDNSGGGGKASLNVKFGYNKNGEFGFWQPYSEFSNNFSSTGLRDEIVGTRFVTLGNNYPDVTKRFNQVIDYTRNYFHEARYLFGDQIFNMGDWNILKNIFFASKVGPNQEFDIKNSDDLFLGFSVNALGGKFATYNGMTWQFQDFGNYIFGVAAKAFGLSLDFALKSAGAAQILWGHDVDWGNIRGFGDPIRDSQMIILGYKRP